MQQYIATGRLDKVFVDNVTPNPKWISSVAFTIISIRLEFPESIVTKHAIIFVCFVKWFWTIIGGWKSACVTHANNMYSRQCYIRIAGIVYLTHRIVFAHLSLNQLWLIADIWKKKLYKKNFSKIGHVNSRIRSYSHKCSSLSLRCYYLWYNVADESHGGIMP